MKKKYKEFFSFVCCHKLVTWAFLQDKKVINVVHSTLVTEGVTSHILRDCIRVRLICEKIKPSFTTSLNVKDRFKSNSANFFDQLVKIVLDFKSFFPLIWLEEEDLLWKENPLGRKTSLPPIRQCPQKFLTLGTNLTRVKRNVYNPIGWSPPSTGTYKFNTNGLAIGSLG